METLHNAKIYERGPLFFSETLHNLFCTYSMYSSAHQIEVGKEHYELTKAYKDVVKLLYSQTLTCRIFIPCILFITDLCFIGEKQTDDVL